RGLASLEIDLFESVERERLGQYFFHAGPRTADSSQEEVRVAQLDLALAGHDADADDRLVGAIANLANVVRDPKLVSARLLEEEDGDRVPLASIDEAHPEKAAHDAAVFGVAERCLSNFGRLDLGALLFGCDLDHAVLDLPGGELLVAMEQVVQLTADGL